MRLRSGMFHSVSSAFAGHKTDSPLVSRRFSISSMSPPALHTDTECGTCSPSSVRDPNHPSVPTLSIANVRSCPLLPPNPLPWLIQLLLWESSGSAAFCRHIELNRYRQTHPANSVNTALASVAVRLLHNKKLKRAKGCRKRGYGKSGGVACLKTKCVQTAHRPLHSPQHGKPCPGKHAWRSEHEHAGCQSGAVPVHCHCWEPQLQGQQARWRLRKDPSRPAREPSTLEAFRDRSSITWARNGPRRLLRARGPSRRPCARIQQEISIPFYLRLTFRASIFLSIHDDDDVYPLLLHLAT